MVILSPVRALNSSADHVVGGADAGTRDVELAGVGFHVGDQFGHVLGREVGVDVQDEGRERHQRHEIEALVRIVLHVAGQRRIDHQRRAAGIDRVAVGRRLGDEVGGDGGRRTGAVVDQHRLAELGRQLVGIDARHGVVHAARRIGHDHGDRLGRPVGLRERGKRAAGPTMRRPRQATNASLQS